MSKSSNGGGIGFMGAMTLLFIGLKLGHVIEWSWWLVLAPLWAPWAVGIMLAVAWAVVEYIQEKDK